MGCTGQLRLTLFGTFTASVVDGLGNASGVSLAARPCSLLAFLALFHGKFFSRSELVDAVWGESGEAATPGTFNTTLWRLRKAIERPPLASGAVIGSDPRGLICLKNEGALRLDVAEFERLVTPVLAKPLAEMTDGDVEALRRGVALYAGEVLTGFSDEWALRQREKHRRYQLNALGRLMQISTLAGDAGGGIRFAQAILDIDSLREDVNRELMRFYMLAGQRALALRQYEICRAALKRELAIQPMPETVALYRQIAEGALRGSETRAHDPDAPGPYAAPQPSPFASARPQPLREGDIDADSGAAASDPAARIALARRHLAAADAQLQLTLPLL